MWLEVQAEGWTSWAGAGGEIPDGYSSLRRWVFAPHVAGVGPCSAWPMDRDMGQYVLPHRPDQPQAPVVEDAKPYAGEATPPTGESGASVRPLVGGIGGAALLVAVALAVVVRRRRSGAQPALDAALICRSACARSRTPPPLSGQRPTMPRTGL